MLFYCRVKNHRAKATPRSSNRLFGRRGRRVEVRGAEFIHARPPDGSDFPCSKRLPHEMRTLNLAKGKDCIGEISGSDRAFWDSLMATKELPVMGHELYVGDGAQLWAKVASEPTYRISRVNAALISQSLLEIAERSPTGLIMIDLAPGAEKSVLASLEIANRLGVRRYDLVDHSEALATVGVRIARVKLNPAVEVSSSIRDIFAGPGDECAESCFVYFGGGTIANLVHPIDTHFPIEKLSRDLQTLMAWTCGGWLLMSFDTTYNRDELERRYGGNANSVFVTGLIRRGAAQHPSLRIDPTAFEYRRHYVDESRQVAHLLVATRTLECPCGDICKGDRFHIMNSYKIKPAWFEEEVENLGAVIEYSALDEDSGIILYLLRCPAQIGQKRGCA